MQKEKIKRIIFYRIGAIGDIIHTLPLIKLCSEMNPLSSIELIIGSEQVKELLDKYCNFITKIHVIKHNGIFDKPIRFFPKLDKTEKLLKESFENRTPDEFIYLHSNKLKAHFLNKRIVNAKKIFVYKRDHELLAVANYAITRYPDLREDLLENPYAVLKHKLLNTSDQEPSDQEPPYLCIVLGVGALRPHRAYPLLKWVQFIDQVIKNTDMNIKILGGPDEIKLNKEFEDILKKREEALKITYQGRIENLIAKTSLVDLAQVLKNSKKLYSADTGILHIAAALDVPIESIFTITSEKRFGAFHPQAKSIRSNSCKCQLSTTNIPKHCSNTKYGYADCVWDIELSSAQPSTMNVTI